MLTGNPGAPKQEQVSFSDVNIAKMFGEHNVLFVAEHHTSPIPKDFLIKHLSEMRSQGATHLFLEMFPKGFDMSDMDNVKKYLFQNWSKGENIPEKFLQVIEVAISLGIRIVGIDIDSAEYRAKDDSTTFRQRNEQWSSEIKNELHNDNKGVVLCGSAHAGYYPANDRANNILEKQGVKSTVVKIADPEDSFPSPEERLILKQAQHHPKGDIMGEVINQKSRIADFIVKVA